MAENQYASFELMAAAGAHELRDGEIVAVGLGLPVVAAFLAKRTHAPNITILLELGIVDPEPIEVGVHGLSDPQNLVPCQSSHQFCGYARYSTT